MSVIHSNSSVPLGINQITQSLPVVYQSANNVGNGGHCCNNNNTAQFIPQGTAYNALLAERENLRIQLTDLQNDFGRDIEHQKKTIIQECEITLEKELREQEVHYLNRIAESDANISSLNSKIVQKDKLYSVLHRDHEVLNKRYHEIVEKVQRKKLKSKRLKAQIEELKKRYKHDLQETVIRKTREIRDVTLLEWDQERNALIQENQTLRNKIGELSKQLTQIPDLLNDIEQFKTLINHKNGEINHWRLKFTKMEQYFESEIDSLKEHISDSHGYRVKIEELKKKLEIEKHREDHIQQKETVVTVEKPTIVEKVVEVVKYVPKETLRVEREPAKQPVIIQELVQNNENYEICIQKLSKKKEKIRRLKEENIRYCEELDMLQLKINELSNQDELHHLQATIQHQSQQIRELERLLSLATHSLADDHHVDSKNRVVVKNQHNEKIYDRVH